MRSPSMLDTWFFVDDDVGARRGNGCVIEVKGAKELGPGGQLGIEARAMEEV